MTYQELNEYIKNYLENDKTHSAIMLSAGWGTGKSHYVLNELLPFLNDNGRKSIVISLYGMQDIAEISRSIYLEALMQKRNKKNYAWICGKLPSLKRLKPYAAIASKSIVKGVISNIGLDVSVTSHDLQNLYSTVDLTDKLLILEDVERCQIDINELLGFVNNMVEQDEVKVLLVTNEKALIKYAGDEEDKNRQDMDDEELSFEAFFAAMNETKEEKKKDPEFTEETKRYLQTKEKTISDTIIFECDYLEAIECILHSFNSKQLNDFTETGTINEIKNLIAPRGKANLRTFIFACQKADDILRRTEDIEFQCRKYIFFSIILFSKRIKRGIIPEWDGSELLSTKLGNTTYPLYRACYDYIRWQQFDAAELHKAVSTHREKILYIEDGAPRDPDIDILASYYIRTEQEVLSCLKRIESRLDNPESIPFHKYGELVWYLVVCNKVLDYDYSRSKEKMLKNIQGKSNKINGEVLFLFYDDNNVDIDKTKYLEFKADILQSLNATSEPVYGFNYEPSNIKEFEDYVSSNERKIASKHEFFSRLDTDKVIDMLFRCNAEQIDDFRGVLWAIYRDAYKGKYVDKDREAMQLMLDKLQERLRSVSPDTDKIILLQFRYLCSNLNTFIDQLS